MVSAVFSRLQVSVLIRWHELSMSYVAGVALLDGLYLAGTTVITK